MCIQTVYIDLRWRGEKRRLGPGGQLFSTHLSDGRSIPNYGCPHRESACLPAPMGRLEASLQSCVIASFRLVNRDAPSRAVFYEGAITIPIPNSTYNLRAIEILPCLEEQHD